MKIKFAHSRYSYDSYTDYRELAKLSGLEQCFIDEINRQEDTIFIISPINGEYRPHIDNHRSEPKNNKLCVWLLERPCAEQPQFETKKLKEFIDGNKKLLDDGYADEIWLSDRWIANLHVDNRIVFMPMGSHPNLNPGPKAWEVWGGDKKFDYIHLSYLTHRRSLVIDPLRVKHKMRECPNSWGEERRNNLIYSKFMINIHQDVTKMGEPLRLALAASAGIPIISETIVDPFPLVPNEHFIQCNWEDMHKIILDAHNKDYRPFAEMGQKLHKLLCVDHKFGNAILEHCRNRKWISS